MEGGLKQGRVVAGPSPFPALVLGDIPLEGLASFLEERDATIIGHRWARVEGEERFFLFVDEGRDVGPIVGEWEI